MAPREGPGRLGQNATTVNNQGVVCLVIEGNVGAIVKLKSETDFVAGSDGFKAEADTLARLVVAEGVDAVAQRSAELEELKILLKEKIKDSATSCASRQHPARSSSTAMCTCRVAAA